MFYSNSFHRFSGMFSEVGGSYIYIYLSIYIYILFVFSQSHQKTTHGPRHCSHAETNAGFFNAFLFAAISQLWVNIVVVAHAYGGEGKKGILLVLWDDCFGEEGKTLYYNS